MKQRALSVASRDYGGRGRLIQRCSECRLSNSLCLCEQIHAKPSSVDFLLLFHRDEIFKPTNTGKLIDDCFPEHTFCFEWSRTEPQPELLQLLNDPKRRFYILYPYDLEQPRELVNAIPVAENDQKIPTLVILDGTWRQSRRMFNSSRWLPNFPIFKLTPEQASTYATRGAAYQNYLSTAESVALALSESGLLEPGTHLQNLYAEFNHRYQQMKENRR